MKKLNKLFALCASVVMILSMTAVASAESVDTDAVPDAYTVNPIMEIAQTAEKDGFTLYSENISTETIADEEWAVTTLVYVKDDINAYVTNTTNSTSRTYQAYKLLQRTASGVSWDWVKIWVAGKFTWDESADTCEVVVDKRNTTYDIVHSHATIVEPFLIESASNKKPLIGKRYAFVEGSIKLANNTSGWGAATLSLELRVKSNGDIVTDPKNADVTEL